MKPIPFWLCGNGENKTYIVYYYADWVKFSVKISTKGRK